MFTSISTFQSRALSLIDTIFTPSHYHFHFISTSKSTAHSLLQVSISIVDSFYLHETFLGFYFRLDFLPFVSQPFGLLLVQKNAEPVSISSSTLCWLSSSCETEAETYGPGGILAVDDDGRHARALRLFEELEGAAGADAPRPAGVAGVALLLAAHPPPARAAPAPLAARAAEDEHHGQRQQQRRGQHDEDHARQAGHALVVHQLDRQPQRLAGRHLHHLNVRCNSSMRSETLRAGIRDGKGSQYGSMGTISGCNSS